MSELWNKKKKICWKNRETFSLQSAKWKKLDFYTWRKIFRKISREISKIEWDINKSAKGAIEIYIFSVKTSISPSRSFSNFFFCCVRCLLQYKNNFRFELFSVVFRCLFMLENPHKNVYRNQFSSHNSLLRSMLKEHMGLETHDFSI